MPSDPALIKDETTFDVKDAAESANARHVRWDELMATNKGAIDVALAQNFMADHYDAYLKKSGPSQRTLCGHEDTAAADPFHKSKPADSPSGAVEGKAADGKMAAAMSLMARIGHPCGDNFDAAAFLKTHPEFRWEEPVLRDMNAGPWTTFHAGEKLQK